MNRFKQFMSGRYGFDQLSQGLVILSLILSVAGTLTHSSILITISYIPFIYAIYRILSRNTNQRIKENYQYTKYINTVKDRFLKVKRKIMGTKTHKYYACPKCKTTIRVPRGKGKICITCPKCRTEFVKRT